MNWEQLSRDREHDRIMREYAALSFDAVMAMLERQFALLHNRSQILLTLCGIVITTTGFSGRFIASTNRWAEYTVILSIVFALLSAAIVVWRVLHLHWLTAQTGDDRSAWLKRSLAYRDVKTRSYRIGIWLLLVALFFYVVAITIMLLHPTAAAAVR